MKDLRFVILSVIGLALAWFIFGGPGRSDTDSPFLRGLSREEKIPEEKTIEEKSDIANELEKVEGELEKIEKELEKAKSKLEASVYEGEVNIGSSSRARETEADREYLRLDVSRGVSGKINITGWKIESPVTGISFEIGKGSYLPYSARVNPEDPVFVEAREKIYIISGRSPIGVSFRTNKCSGYFEQFQDFEPSLPRQCPRPIDDLDALVDVGGGASGDACVDFVEDLNRCEVYLKTIPLNLSGACSEYITEKINYNTCVDLHKDDKDFKGGEWYIYLGRTEDIWKKSRELIKLVDAEGKTVDAVTY